MSSEQSTLDQAALDNLLESVGGDREFLGELMDTFFEDTAGQLAAIQQALATGDAEALRRAAHSLKSNSLNFGATALAELCKELEERGKTGALAGGAELATQIEAGYEEAKRALEALRAAG
jgi:HPt (histidine-containing phosphotransfer) domain-containing protein